MTLNTDPTIVPEIQDFAGTINRAVDAISNWVTQHYIELVIALIIGTGIFFVLGAVKRLAVRYVRKQESLTGYRAILTKAIAKTTNIFMLMVSAQIVIVSSNAPAKLVNLVGVLFTIIVVVQVAIWLREIILGFFTRKLSTDPDEYETLANAMTLIRLLVTFVLFAIAAIMILDNLGVDVTGLIAGLGVGGIAIGLAAQGIFSDLFAALSIIFDKPFRQGETITYDTTTGTIEKIGLKSTRLRAVTGEEIIISNTNLLDKEITLSLIHI